MNLTTALLNHGPWIALACIVAFICIRSLAKLVLCVALIAAAFTAMQMNGIDITSALEQLVKSAIGII